MKSFLKFFHLSTFFSAISLSISVAQTHNSSKDYRQLILGSWIYTDQQVGLVIAEFYGNGTGFRKNGFSKRNYFSYLIVKDSILRLTAGKYKPEFYVIKLLNSSELHIRDYPYKKYRESISVFATDYTRKQLMH